MENENKIIIFSAPSGSGKSSIVRELLKDEKLNLEFSVSATSRVKRDGEIQGKDYYFLTPQQFRQEIKNEQFLEYEEVYPDTYYGTLKSEVQRVFNKGKNLVLDIDVIGGINIKKKYPLNAHSIFIMPPSIEELKRRLILRDTETDDKIELRIKKAEKELSYHKNFDYVIINQDLKKAIQQAKNKIEEIIKNK